MVDELMKGFLVKEKRVLRRIENEEIEGRDIEEVRVTGSDRN